jgi:uncharacterized protein (TIGR03067 family)
MIRPAAIALLAGLLLAAAPASENDDPREDMERLEGAWRGDSLQIKGNYLLTQEARSLLLLFAKDTFRVEQGGRVTVKGTFTLDATHKPKTIDLAITETVQAENKGTMVLGIFELDKSTLTLCTTKANGLDRPKKLASRAGSTHTLFTFKREKP